MREPLEYETSHMVTAGKIYLGHTWWYFKDYDMTFMAPPKCGSSSIKQFIWMNELEDRVKNVPRPLQGKVCVVTRLPHERFVSLWKSKCRDKENIRFPQVHGMSMHELVDFIKTGARDIHWERQVDIISAGKAKPDEIIQLPHLTEWWREQGFGELGNFNVTEGDVRLDEDIEDWIRARYAADYDLYETASNSVV